VDCVKRTASGISQGVASLELLKADGALFDVAQLHGGVAAASAALPSGALVNCLEVGSTHALHLGVDLIG
jgi:hypothetical protein